MVFENKFIEYEMNYVNKYGTSKQEIHRIQAKG